MNAAFFFWPAGFASGHESFQATLLEGLLAQQRHRITVVVDGNYGAMSLPAPHRVATFRSPRRWVGHIVSPFDTATERAAGAAVRASGAEALIACANFPTPRVDVPLLATLHETDFLDPAPWHWYPAGMVQRMGAETRRALARASAVFANSRYTADRAVRDHGVAADAAFVAAPGVRPFPGDPIRVPQFPPYVAQVGWFAARKDLLLALRSWVTAVRDGLDRDLVLIGRDGPTNHLDGLVARQVLEETAELAHRVHIVGHVTRSEYGALLAGADALLATSHQEGFCIPVIEAFSVGTPVVAVRRTALIEVAGPAGILVEPSPQAVAHGLWRAVSETSDRVAMKEYAAQFTPANQAAPVLAFLDRLAAGPG